MKRTVIAILMGLTLSASAQDFEQICRTEAGRVWDAAAIADKDGKTRDGQAAQWWLAGCRAGAKLATAAKG